MVGGISLATVEHVIRNSNGQSSSNDYNEELSNNELYGPWIAIIDIIHEREADEGEDKAFGTICERLDGCARNMLSLR